ncbi:sigma-54-dependent Fis family transcriptional regulator [Mucilaginibacter sp. cycad4]|uniref:sigma-54 dependent transcriptional regulator n=1 Tax=Mucilaginibacter sp. cycad4 TaxID=3342096 RepID=UPI002AAAC2A0|nr:sigma-54-dependent Fis family transcriptional regulator [Mucilaginibacter gossypii]WPU99130.1 sigma-54-dependent Fis family transcriptional regulator [Mucilaginibacter gossypii]
MKDTILIVEDEFIVANDLSLIIKKAGYKVCGIAATVDQARNLVDKYNPTWVLLDIFLQDGSKGTDLAPYLTERKIGFIYISANANQRILEIAKLTSPYGYILKPFREKDLIIMLEIATEKHRQNIEFEKQREEMLRMQIKSVCDNGHLPKEQIAMWPSIFQALIPFDYFRVRLQKRQDNHSIEEFSYIREGYDRYKYCLNNQLPESMELNRKDSALYKPTVANGKKAGYANGNEFRQLMFDDLWERVLCSHFDFQSKLSLPLLLTNGYVASLDFYSKNPDGFSGTHLSLLLTNEEAIGQLIMNIKQLSGNGRLENESSTINPKSLVSAGNFDGIVGNSPELLKVLDNISLVSQSEITVLITGESGTGKEKVAQNIHKLSSRRQKPFITVNCAALPHELIESELFGHEKGAYTGASERRIGKFELANGGTIFLDEIGEMPLDAQVKLLRVLQEKEIDHLGGKHSVKVDVRVVAATNRTLEKEVAEGRFRLDLYYRLNVFPVHMPPLRDRKVDIPALSAHFLNVYAKDTGKKISGFSQFALDQLQGYDWPGNIRELGHLIQRSMIMTNGKIIDKIDLPGNVKEDENVAKIVELKTLEEMETSHILGVLQSCRGKVCGAGGAAEILGLPPSTLNSKIKKLGIKRESYFNL